MLRRRRSQHQEAELPQPEAYHSKGYEPIIENPSQDETIGSYESEEGRKIVGVAKFAEGNISLQIHGKELDLYTADIFKAIIADQVEAHPEAANVVIDMSNTTFIDSSTLGILVGFYRVLKEGGGERKDISFKIIADRNIQKMFEITGLDRIFDVVLPPKPTSEDLASIEVSPEAKAAAHWQLGFALFGGPRSVQEAIEAGERPSDDNLY